jgi:trigger factor
MNVNIENTSSLRRKLTIELEPAEINRELDRAYNELRRTVQIKGFRPGRAPRKLLERLFGDQVRGDVVQRLINEYTDKALKENNFSPVAVPEIVTEETDLAKPSMRFSATFDIKPEIVVRDYQGLKVQKPEVQVSEQDIDTALDRLRERQAVLRKVEDRTVVETGDFVLAEAEGSVDGKPLPGAKIEERLLEVSPKALAHGLDEVLTGSGTGKPVQTTRSYATDYPEKELAGRDVEWRCTVKEIFRRELPNLDDEFAKDQGDFRNLEALRTKVREQLVERARDEADARARQGLLDLIIERNPIEVPESLVAREQQALEAELAATLEASGLVHEQAAEQVRANSEELKARAEKRARSGLIIDALADQEKVEVDDDQVADRIASIVTRSGRERDRMASLYSRAESRAALKRSMRREMTLDLLLTRAQSESETVAREAPSGSNPL